MNFDPLDIMRGFDPLDRLEGAISTFLNADWHGAWKRGGVVGVISEVGACVLAYNAPTIHVSRANARGADVERLLAEYGIRIWDRGAWKTELYFCVKRRQVKWAEYVLKRAGYTTTREDYDPRNTEWAARHTTPVPAWKDKK
jgi:hypothetical protein